MMRSLMITIILAMTIATAASPRLPEYKITKTEIAKLSPEMQRVFAGTQYLLNGYQARQFLTLPNDEKRKSWLDVFWQLRDPTPTTRKNEMLIEHNIRVKLAGQFYKSSKWPGWDKRGEVFIRYGPPEYRGKVWGEITSRGMEPPREIWYYHHHNMLVTFQNFALKGEYIYSIDPLGSAEKLSPDLVEFLLYDTSASLSSKIPQDMLEFYTTPASAPPDFVLPAQNQAYKMSTPRAINDDIDAIIDPDRIEMLPSGVAEVFHRDQIQKVANNFEIVLEETPSSYPFNFEDNSLNFYFGVDQFKGGETSSRVEVQLELPVVIETEGDESFEETYHAEVVVWNAQFEEVTRKTRDIVLKMTPDVGTWSNLLPSQLVMSLDEGYYRAAVTVRGERSGKSSSFRTAFSCQRFTRGLALSDIVFARSIAQSEQPSIFTKGALEVVPHPLRAYSRSFPIPIYFEVYNLVLDSRGVSAYTIEYKIIPHQKTKKRFWDRFREATPVISSKFESSGFNENEVQHITVRGDNLGKGSFDFLVTITDDVSQVSTYRKGTFSIID